MDQDEQQKWYQGLHGGSFFAKIRPFSHITDAFAEELTASAEYSVQQAGSGL